jgi:CHAT domain-containing protein
MKIQMRNLLPLSPRSFFKIQVLIAFVLFSLPTAAQEIQPDVRQLMIGEKTERKVVGQEVHIYGIELKRGQVLRVSFQEKGVDIAAVTVRVLDRQKASAATNFGSGYMQESLTLVPDQDGAYALVVRAQQITDPNIEARYEFTATLNNTASQKDLQRVQAEKLLEEGSQSIVSSDKKSLLSAVTNAQESIKLWQILADRYWYGIARMLMGTAYFKDGDFGKAEPAFNEAIKIFEDTNDVPAVAAAAAALGSLYVITKNEEKARIYVSRAVEYSRKIGDKRAENLLSFLNGASLVAEASETNNQSYVREIAAARAKNDKLAEAAIWGKTLFHYVIEEDSIRDEDQRALFEKAEREALPLIKLVKNRDLELQILLGLGIGFYDLTLGADTDEEEDRVNVEKSMNYLRQAIILAKIQNDLLMQWLAYEQLNLFYDGDNNRLAIFFGKKGINLLQGLRQDLKIADKESQQEATQKLEEDYSTLAADLLYESRLAEAHQVINLSRDQEFFDFKLIQNQTPSKLVLTPRETEIEQLFDSAIERIAAKYATRPDADYRLAGNELKAVFDNLAQNFSDPASEKDIARNVPDTADMQSALRELSSKTGRKYAVIYFVSDVGEILLITPESIKAFTSSLDDLKTYVTSDKVDKYILEFLGVLRSPGFDPRPLGAQIYNKIFKTRELINGRITKTTLEAELTRYNPNVLLWSLSGNIRYVPVAALYDAEKKQYLVEKYQNAVFTRARKERFLVEPKPWAQGVGLGTSIAYQGFSPLPGVVNELSAIFGNPATKQKGLFTGQVFLNRAFTRQALLAIAQTKPALVHVASHFKFQPGDSRNSFLLLGDGNKFSLFDMQQNLNLFDGVDLLTLSACETAAQQSGANGKEVDGFAELAQRLGASSVIATLWKVSDNETSRLMTEFYRLRQENPNMPKSEILRQAQLNLLNGKSTAEDGAKRRTSRVAADADVANEGGRIPFKAAVESPFEHPYYWAPFVLFGSSR